MSPDRIGSSCQRPSRSQGREARVIDVLADASRTLKEQRQPPENTNRHLIGATV